MEPTREEKVVQTTPEQTHIQNDTRHNAPSPASDSIGANEKISPAPSFDEAMRKDGEMKHNPAVDERELGLRGTTTSDAAVESEEKPVPKWKQLRRKYMWVFYTFLWLVMTA